MEEINTIDDLVLKLTNVKLPWDEFCLLGKTELKLFSTHKERGNMYCPCPFRCWENTHCSNQLKPTHRQSSGSEDWG